MIGFELTENQSFFQKTAREGLWRTAFTWSLAAISSGRGDMRKAWCTWA